MIEQNTILDEQYDLLCMLHHPKYIPHTKELVQALDKKYKTINVIDDKNKTYDLKTEVSLSEDNPPYKLFEQRTKAINAKVCIAPSENPEGGEIKVNILHHANIKPYSREKYFIGFKEAHYHLVATKTQLRLIKSILEERVNELEHTVCLVPAGYPKLDKVLYDLEQNMVEKDSICYAPTLLMHNKEFQDGLSLNNGVNIIETLLNNFPQYNIIFRPHPHIKLYNYKTAGLNYIDEIIEKFRENKRFIYDESDYYIDTFLRTQILITDFSSIMQTFAFTTLCPFVSLSNEKFINHYHDVFGEEDIRNHCGVVVNDFGDFISTVKETIKEKDKFRAKIAQYRDEEVFNIGKSVQYITDNFNYIMDSKYNKDWIYIGNE